MANWMDALNAHYNKERESYTNRENKVLAELNSVVRDAEVHGAPFDEADIAELYQMGMSTGRIDTTQLSKFRNKAGVSDVVAPEAAVAPKPVMPESREASSWLDRATAVIPGASEVIRGIGDLAEQASNQIPATFGRERVDEATITLRRDDQPITEGRWEGLTTKAPRWVSAEELEAQRQRRIAAAEETLRTDAPRVEARSRAAQEARESAAQRLGTDVPGMVVGGISGVIGEPEQLASTVGTIGGAFTGPAAPVAVPVLRTAGAALAAETAYDRYLAEAYNLSPDVTDDEAETYAAVQTGIEFGTEFIGGKLAGGAAQGARKLGLTSFTPSAAREALAKKLTSRGARIAKTAVTSGIEEAAAEGLSDVADVGFEQAELFSSPEAREAQRQKVIENSNTRVQRMIEAGIGGAAAGAAIASPVAAYQYSRERAKELADDLAANARNLNEELSRIDRSTAAPAPTAVEQPSLFPEAQTTGEDFDSQEAARQKQLEEDAAYSLRNRQRTAETRDQNREDLRNSVTRRVDSARERVESLQERVEEGDTSSATLNEFATANRELQDAESALSTFDEQFARPVETATPARETAVEQPEPVQQDMFAQQEQAEDQRLTGLLATQKSALADKQAADAKKQQANDKKRERQLALKILQDNPNATAEEQVALLRQELAKPVEAKPTKVTSKKEAAKPQPAPATTPDDSSLSGLAKTMGLDVLGMAPDEAATRTKVADNEDKTRSVLTKLIEKGDDTSTAVRSLVRQGKLVIAPSAESIGRAAGNQGEYDVKNGRVYLYLDQLGDNPPTSAIITSIHEAVHGGQFNKRDGREKVMATLLGDEGVGNTANRIRRAAERGNKVAQAAVRQAQRSAQQAADPDRQFVEDVETAGYFASEVAKRRGQALGAIGGIVQDMRTAGRRFLRDNLGASIDVDINDLASASQRSVEELVETDITPSQDSNIFGMVHGAKSTKFRKAVDEGRTFFDLVDQREKFVEADDKSRIIGPGKRILMSGKDVPVRSLLEHDELFDAYPSLRNVTVRVEPNRPKEAAFLANPDGPVVVIGSDIANSNMLRSVLLHELQHGVQSIEGSARGANPNMFWTSQDTADLQERDRLAIEYRQATNPETRAFLQAELLRADDRLFARVRERYEQYRRTRGEQEASFTEENVDTPQDQLPVNPTDRYYGGPDGTYISPNVFGMSAVQRAPKLDSEEFKEWFGDSKIVNKDGSPKVYFHGTGARFSIFRPQDGMIFASPEIGFAKLYAHPKWNEATQRYEVDDVGVMSLYVRAENPFDYDNPEHVKAIANNRYAQAAWRALVRERQQYDPDYGMTLKEALETGSWDILEDRIIKQAIRNEGHDSMFVAENFWDEGLKESRTAKNIAVFNSNQLKSTQNTGKFSLTDNNIYGMAAQPKADEVSRWTQLRWKTPPSLLWTVSNSLGTGKKALEAVEYAQSSPAAVRAEAEGIMGNYIVALKQLADSTNTDFNTLNNTIEKELKELDKVEGGYEANRQAFNEVVAKYGEAGQALQKLRNLVDDQSYELVRERAKRAAEGVPLTESEKATYAKIINEMGRYNHRQYAAFSQKAGQDYANTIWNDYLKYKKKQGNDVSDRVRDNYNVVAKGVKAIIDDSLMIPDDQAIQSMPAVRARSLYSRWVDARTADLADLDTIKQRLSEVRDAVGEGRLLQAAEQVAQELLGLTASPDNLSAIAKSYRTGSLDGTILKHRNKIPQEIRDMLGEITDPALALVLTASKQAEFLATNRMLLELRGLEKDVAAPDSLGDVPENWTQAMGPSWGALEGHYISPQLRTLVGAHIEQIAGLNVAIREALQNPKVIQRASIQKAADLWGWAANKSKAVSVVWNFANLFYNGTGSFVSLMSKGNNNPEAWLNGAKAAVSLVRYAAEPSAGLSPEAMRATKYGVIDSSSIGEIKAENYRQLSALIKKMSGRTPSKTKEMIHDVVAIVRESYAMADVWAKIANFEAESDFLKKYYEAAGESRTDDQIYREAAAITNRTNLSYKRALPLLKAMERGGVTAFAPYVYETFRTEVSNVLQGFDELSAARNAPTPEAGRLMAGRAAKRILGQTAAWSLWASIAHSLASTFGEDDEERRGQRLGLPEYLRDQDFIKVGEAEKGKPILMNVSRFDPVGPVTDIMRAVIHNEGDIDAIKQKVIDLYIMPRIAPSVVELGTALVTGKSPSREPLVQQRLPEAYSGVVRMMDAAGFSDGRTRAVSNFLEKLVMPGHLNALRDSNEVPEGDKALEWSRAAGFTFYKSDAAKLVPSAAYEYKQEIQSLRGQLADVFKNRVDVTEDEIYSEVLNSIGDEKEAFRKVKDAYDGMLANGMSKREAIAKLKESKVPVDTIKDVVTDDFTSRVISTDSLTSYAKSHISKGRTKEERNARRAMWRNALGQVKKVQKLSREEE